MCAPVYMLVCVNKSVCTFSLYVNSRLFGFCEVACTSLRRYSTRSFVVTCLFLQDTSTCTYIHTHTYMHILFV